MKYRIFLLIFSIIPITIIYQASQFEVSSYDASGGPGEFPTYVAGLMLILLIVQFIRSFIQENREVIFKELFKGKTGFFVGTFLIYIIVMNYIGFLLASCIYLPCAVCFLKYKTYGKLDRKKVIIEVIGCLVFVALIFLFFTELINVRLPGGELF